MVEASSVPNAAAPAPAVPMPLGLCSPKRKYEPALELAGSAATETQTAAKPGSLLIANKSMSKDSETNPVTDQRSIRIFRCDFQLSDDNPYAVGDYKAPFI